MGTHMKEYDILLRTPLGDREGRLSLCALQGRLEGEMQVLEHATPFSGEIDESGLCRITGHLITALSTVPFVATGYIRPQRLDLVFQHRQQPFQIVGNAR